MLEDNKSVDIIVFRQEDRHTIPFSEELQLMKHSEDQAVVKNLLAQPGRMTSVPTLGRFNAIVTIDIYYK